MTRPARLHHCQGRLPINATVWIIDRGIPQVRTVLSVALNADTFDSFDMLTDFCAGCGRLAAHLDS